MEHFHSSKYFRECVEPLTTLYGSRISGPDVKEKMESWVGYALYHAGYWVWGPHAHEDHLKEEGKNKRGYGQFLGKGTSSEGVHSGSIQLASNVRLLGRGKD